MVNLRLFPLNTVLFPSMPLALHIFEERYKTMINECLTENQPFGVVLIQEGLEALGPLARPYSVGCTAHIAKTEQLAEGRLNILTVGGERFRILSLSDREPYLSGDVDMFPLKHKSSEESVPHQGALLKLLKRYLAALATAKLVNLSDLKMPQVPEEIAWFAAYLLQVPAAEKQSFLEVETTADIINSICDRYRIEVPLVETMLASTPSNDHSRYSPN